VYTKLQNYDVATNLWRSLNKRAKAAGQPTEDRSQKTGDNLKALQTRMKRDNKHNYTRIQLSKRTTRTRTGPEGQIQRPRTTSCE